MALRVSKALSAFAAAACLAGCRAAPSAPRQIVLISVDTLRQDALGCYGNREVSTPHIDALAREGVLFRQAFAHVPSTLPSHASMFFSEYPWRLGVYRNDDKIPARADSLQGILQKLGYRTAAFTSLAVLNASTGLAQGFDDYFDDVVRDPGRPYLFAEELNEEVLEWLEVHHRERFFLFIHYSDPHEPYAPKDAPPDMELVLNGSPIARLSFLKRESQSVPLALRSGRNTLVFRPLAQAHAGRGRSYEIQKLRLEPPGLRAAPVGDDTATADVRAFVDSASYTIDSAKATAARLVFRGKALLSRREIKRQYLREVEAVDRAVGALVAGLKAVGAYEDALLLLVADHGEGLWDHGIPGHEGQVYLSQLAIPFLLRDGRHANRHSSQAVTLLDVAPTLLSYVAGRRPEAWRGRDLRGSLEGRADIGKEPVDVRGATFWGRSSRIHWKLSVLRPPHHLVVTLPAGRREYYDVAADPGERRNLLRDATEAPGLDALAGPLHELSREVEAGLAGRALPQISAERAEQLRALGYLGGEDP